MFNPFDEETVKRFIQALLQLPRGRARSVIYYRCDNICLFRADPHFRVSDVPVPEAFQKTAKIDFCWA